MKISRLEQILLCCTALFLLFSVGYYLSAQGASAPYRVDTQTQRRLSAPSAAPADGEAEQAQERLNLNTATAHELQALPGIGERRAADIVADRAEHGPFRIAEDITRVSGIGEGTLSGIIDLICVE